MSSKTPQIRDFYVNTKQIADRFCVSTTTIKRWIRLIDLPVFQLHHNSPYMVFEDDIQNEWIPMLRDYLIEETKKISQKDSPKKAEKSPTKK